MYYKDKDRGMDWFAYLKPFGGYTWLCVILTTAFSGVTYIFAERVRNRSEFKLSSSLWTVVHGMFCQGSPDEPTSLSSRIVFLVVFGIGFLAWSAYSATLTSILAIKLNPPPFTSLESMLYQTRYNIVTVYGSIEHKFKVC